MPKSGNTKSRRISAADAGVICACLLGTAAFLGLFQRDLYRSLRLIDQEPVGFVASKSRAAMRRFQDRIIWDRLQKDSPVYNGDFIRTAEHSEAAVSFPGGAMVGVSENTSGEARSLYIQLSTYGLKSSEFLFVVQHPKGRE